jgi:hypothetical protein
MSPRDLGRVTARPLRLPRPREIVPRASALGEPSRLSSHAALLATERSAIEAYLAAECRGSRSDPMNVFFVVVDLRGDFGRRLGLHVLERVTLDRRVRGATACGVASLSVPMSFEHGVALVELVAPEWLAWLRERPLLSLHILVVDAEDVARLAFGRLRTAPVLKVSGSGRPTL